MELPSCSSAYYEKQTGIKTIQMCMGLMGYILCLYLCEVQVHSPTLLTQSTLTRIIDIDLD
jgi:hypothetical protein